MGTVPTIYGLCISKESLEAIVHVLLDMTVEQSKPRLVGREIDSSSAIVRNDDRIFDHASSPFPIDLGQFPEMAVQMHGMSVVGAVAHDQPVPNPVLKDEFAFVRIRLAVDEPEIEFAGSARDLLEDQFDGLLGSGRVGAGGPKDGVVPAGLGRIDPLRWMMLICVLDDHAQPRFAHRLFGRAENPDTGIVHLDLDIDALARAKEDGIERLRRWDRVSIESDYFHLVSG